MRVRNGSTRNHNYFLRYLNALTQHTLQCGILQVSNLERQLQEATEASKVCLSEKEHKFLIEKQLLIKELESEKRNSEKTREILVDSHAKQLANQESEHNKQLKVHTIVC